MGSSINLKLGTTKAAGYGSADDSSAKEMERRIVTIRWLAILVSSGALPFLNLGKSLVPLLGMIAVGAVYNLAIQAYILPRRPGWLTRGYVSAIGDVLLVTGGVAVTGGIQSPFFLAYFAVCVTSAVRFGGVAAVTAGVPNPLRHTPGGFYHKPLPGTRPDPEEPTQPASRTRFVGTHRD